MIGRLGPILVLFFLTRISLAQSVDLISLDQLQTLIHKKGEGVNVINFWATWCAPCVKEMPLFEKLRQEHPEVKVLLVSMDMDLDPNPEKVNRFVSRKKIQSPVVILNERDPNSFIDKIEKSWSGALPATLFINPATGKRQFIERELHEGELEKFIAELK
jgi:thiol-disulfide isomerase/thioredoxin